jgi:lipopolysaccharide heptosyltransferase II
MSGLHAAVGACPGPQRVAPAWRTVRRLLAIRLDNLGDLLMTTPALAAIRDSLPDVHLGLLCSPTGARAAAHLDSVDEVIAFTAPWMRVGMAGSEGDQLGQEERALLQRLREARYDAAVIFSVCTQSALPAALLCLQAGIPLRLAHCRENPYALLSDWVRETDSIGSGMRHEVQRQLDLVGAVGMHTGDERLRFAIDEADRRQVAALLGAQGIDADEPLVLVHPGASAASRRWPAPRFGQAAEAIREASGSAVVFSGDADDAPLIAQAQGAMHEPAPALTGQLGLGQLAALIDRAQVLVTNNSGPAHLAAAVGTPVVDLYALTNPQHTPWRVPARVLSHDVPCRWCLKSSCPQLHHDCLRGVAWPEVVEAALALLRGEAGSTAVPSPAETAGMLPATVGSAFDAPLETPLAAAATAPVGLPITHRVQVLPHAASPYRSR